MPYFNPADDHTVQLCYCRVQHGWATGVEEEVEKYISFIPRLAQLRSTKCIMSTHMHNVLLQGIFYRDCGHNMPVPKPTMCPLELLRVVSKYKDLNCFGRHNWHGTVFSTGHYYLQDKRWCYELSFVPFWLVNPGENPVAVLLPDQGVLLTVNDFLIKAAALTMEVSKI